MYFEVSKDIKYMYIFSKQILVDQKVIGNFQNKGITTFGLPVPGSSTNKKNKLWTQYYINNFELLKFN